MRVVQHVVLDERRHRAVRPVAAPELPARVRAPHKPAAQAHARTHALAHGCAAGRRGLSAFPNGRGASLRGARGRGSPVQRTHSRPTTSTAAEWPRPALISTIASDASASIRRGVRESSRVSFRACVVRHSAHAWCVCARARAEGGGVRRRNGSAGICGARLSASARQRPRTTSREWAGRGRRRAPPQLSAEASHTSIPNPHLVLHVIRVGALRHAAGRGRQLGCAGAVPELAVRIIAERKDLSARPPDRRPPVPEGCRQVRPLPCRMGYHAVWDTTPCRVECRACIWQRAQREAWARTSPSSVITSVCCSPHTTLITFTLANAITCVGVVTCGTGGTPAPCTKSARDGVRAECAQPSCETTQIGQSGADVDGSEAEWSLAQSCKHPPCSPAAVGWV